MTIAPYVHIQIWSNIYGNNEKQSPQFMIVVVEKWTNIEHAIKITYVNKIVAIMNIAWSFSFRCSAIHILVYRLYLPKYTVIHTHMAKLPDKFLSYSTANKFSLSISLLLLWYCVFACSFCIANSSNNVLVRWTQKL